MANPINRPTLHLKRTSDPLFRFPFANFLANPCAFSSPAESFNQALMNRPVIVSRSPNSLMIRLIDPSEQIYPSSPNALSLEATALSQQALELLNPFRDRYSGRNYTTEERQIVSQELNLALHETKHFNRRIYHPSVSSLDAIIKRKNSFTKLMFVCVSSGYSSV